MEEYPKIETLYERDERTFRVDRGRLRRPEFGLVERWVATEKVDGTNIRVGLTHFGLDGVPVGGAYELKIAGRTDRAQIPPALEAALRREFNVDNAMERFSKAFELAGDDPVRSVVLYGEGYGAGIQSGGIYRDDQGFILFDALVDGRWWLKPQAVKEVAVRMGLDMVPVVRGSATLEEVTRLAQDGLQSRVARGQVRAEGVVCRPIENLFDQRGERVAFKLKTRDFTGGKR